MSYARKTLQNVKDDEKFRLATGGEIKNLNDLLSTLDSISEETFRHHVDGSKNDFASWIRNSVGDVELARSLESTRSFDETKDIIRVRIAYLKSLAEMDEKRVSEDETHDGIDDSIMDDGDFQSVFDELKISNSTSSEEEEEASPQVPNKDDMPAFPQFSGTNKPEEDAHLAPPPADAPAPSYMQQGSEKHPFEHAKVSFMTIIRDILVGLVVGLVIGYMFGVYFS